MKDQDWKGTDKLKHFVACYVIALWDTEGAVMAALAKEYGDKGAPSNHWCWWDLAWDAAGIILGTATRMSIKALVG